MSGSGPAWSRDRLFCGSTFAAKMSDGSRTVEHRSSDPGDEVRAHTSETQLEAIPTGFLPDPHHETEQP